MKTIIMYLFIAATIAACSSEEADIRSRQYSSDADARAEYNDSIHWDNTKTPADDKEPATTKKPVTPVEDEIPEEAEPADPIAMRDLSPSLGIRNLDQIRYSMASITGVSARGANIQAAYAELRSQLPDTNDIRSLTPAKISAITKLGAQFCDEAMLDQQIRADLLPGIDFSAPPSAALTNPGNAAQMLIERFWGTNLSTRADPAEDVDTLSTLISDLIAEQPNTAQATASILMGACTAVISSAPFIML